MWPRARKESCNYTRRPTVQRVGQLFEKAKISNQYPDIPAPPSLLHLEVWGERGNSSERSSRSSLRSQPLLLHGGLREKTQRVQTDLLI
ncbi:hypothetical protein EYF80_035048 [Liparis tanakae]|uniref:Uncharacterized protein n=1 Tax=Liparis tanakae TaxID=230148 RepID=A0A4Z2GNP0_9TELE|nr:hypothetical protein EYF80_035048 [Liparis tanakae]